MTEIAAAQAFTRSHDALAWVGAALEEQIGPNNTRAGRPAAGEFLTPDRHQNPSVHARIASRRREGLAIRGEFRYA